jgi:predicted extracellular nuclease
MSEGSEMKEYRQGDIVHLPVTVQDPSGVQVVYSTAIREESVPGADLQKDQIRLEATTTQAQRTSSNPEPLELQAQVTDQTPGVYTCQEIQAFDMLDQESITLLNPPLRFRIVESVSDDQEGPELLQYGDFS